MNILPLLIVIAVVTSLLCGLVVISDSRKQRAVTLALVIAMLGVGARLMLIEADYAHTKTLEVASKSVDCGTHGSLIATSNGWLPCK